jgi:N-acyl homoserine lactone hydrolase
MHIHAIQTGTVAIKEGQRVGKGKGLQKTINVIRDKQWTEPLPIYAWVIEHPEGIIVIDTGETARAAKPGYFPGWHPLFRLCVHEWVQPEDEIGPQLRTRGISPDDVRWVIMTHLHTDHAGGLSHFPKAEILVTRKEFQSTRGIGGQIAGYLPQHWPNWFEPHLVDFQAHPGDIFPEQLTLTQAGDVILVSTPGHSAGHMSVILQEEEQSIFFAGDTSYTQNFLLESKIDGVTLNDQISRQTIQRIQAYAEQTPTVYLPSHDPEAADRLEKRQSIERLITKH